MTVAELIEQLTDLAQPDSIVRLKIDTFNDKGSLVENRSVLAKEMYFNSLDEIVIEGEIKS